MTTDPLSPATRAILQEADQALSRLSDQLAAVQPDTIAWPAYRRLNDLLADNAASLLRVRAAQAIEDRLWNNDLEAEKAARDQKAAELRKEYDKKIKAVREAASANEATARVDALNAIDRSYQQLVGLRQSYSDLGVNYPDKPDLQDVPTAKRPGPSLSKAIAAFQIMPIKFNMTGQLAAVSVGLPFPFLAYFLGFSLGLIGSLLGLFAVFMLIESAKSRLVSVSQALRNDCANIAFDLQQEIDRRTRITNHEVDVLESELATTLQHRIREGLEQAEQIDQRRLQGRQILLDECTRLDTALMAALSRFRQIEAEFLARNQQALAAPETKDANWVEPAPRQLRLGWLAMSDAALIAHADRPAAADTP